MTMRNLTACVSVLLLATLVVAGQSTDRAKKPATPDALQAEIENLRPAKLAWREIPWKTCLLEALKESREKEKPVLLWIVGPGEALEGRC
jgi:hypothetical protein